MPLLPPLGKSFHPFGAYTRQHLWWYPLDATDIFEIRRMLALKLKNMDKATEAMKDCSLSEKEPQKLK